MRTAAIVVGPLRRRHPIVMAVSICTGLVTALLLVIAVSIYVAIGLIATAWLLVMAARMCAALVTWLRVMAA